MQLHDPHTQSIYFQNPKAFSLSSHPKSKIKRSIFKENQILETQNNQLEMKLQEEKTKRELVEIE